MKEATWQSKSMTRCTEVCQNTQTRSPREQTPTYSLIRTPLLERLRSPAGNTDTTNTVIESTQAQWQERGKEEELTPTHFGEEGSCCPGDRERGRAP